MNETDLRVIKTKKRIMEAFIKLLQNKAYKTIKVSDISKEALINRNTFYLHYSSKEELVKEIEKLVKNHTKSLFIISPNPVDANMIRLIISNLLDQSYNYRSIFRGLLLDAEMNKVFVSIKKTIKSSIADLFLESISPPALEFISSGIYGVLEAWILSDNIDRNSAINDCTQFFTACIHK